MHRKKYHENPVILSKKIQNLKSEVEEFKPLMDTDESRLQRE